MAAAEDFVVPGEGFSPRHRELGGRGRDYELWRCAVEGRNPGGPGGICAMTTVQG